MKNILVKVSGDLINNTEARKFLLGLVDPPKDIIISVITGGTTQVNKKLESKGHKVQFEGGHRLHDSEESRLLAANILSDLALHMESHLSHSFVVKEPVIWFGARPCHINADDYLCLLEPNFDEAYCLTKKGRVKDFPSQIQVVAFD